MRKEIKLSDLMPSGVSFGRKPRTAVRRRVMPKEIVGLKIDSAELSAALVANNGDKHLLKVARAPLSSGIVTAGEVRDPVALGIALAEFFATNALPRRGVQLGLGNSRIGVRLIDVADTGDSQQLENVIRFRAHEMISASLDEAIIDYHVVGTGVDADGAKTRRILLVVAYRDSINRYLKATDAAELDVAGIDLEAFALLRATSAPPSGDVEPSTALVAVAVDRERTTLAISDGAICQFTRVLEWGDANIDTSVGRALAMTATEAAPFWRQLPVAGEEPPTGEDAAKVTTAREVVRHELQSLIRELQSSLRFYQAQPNALTIDVVHVSGLLTDIPGVADELRERLGLAVEVIDPFARFRLAESVTRPERAGNLTVALGLGIED